MTLIQTLLCYTLSCTVSRHRSLSRQKKSQGTRNLSGMHQSEKNGEKKKKVWLGLPWDSTGLFCPIVTQEWQQNKWEQPVHEWFNNRPKISLKVFNKFRVCFFHMHCSIVGLLHCIVNLTDVVIGLEQAVNVILLSQWASKLCCDLTIRHADTKARHCGLTF